MLGKLLVSGGGKLGLVSLEKKKMIKETPIEGCGAVCMLGETVFAAGENDSVVYRLDKNLLLSGVYAGGPGMRGLCACGDGERLCVLMGDADSVMMLSASDGTPMLLARAGVDPQRMRMDEMGKHLIIAGGKDGRALLLCPYTLRLLRAIREEGVCVDALLLKNTLCMLNMTDAMHTQLALHRMHGIRRAFHLPGMPGSLCASGPELLVSAGEWLYAFDVQAMRIKRKMPTGGICGELWAAGSRLLLLSPVHERLYMMDGCSMDLLCSNVCHAAISG